MGERLTLRGLWIVGTKFSSGEEDDLGFGGDQLKLQRSCVIHCSRRWGTVEARARAWSSAQQKPYGSFASDKELASKLTDQLFGTPGVVSSIKSAHSIESIVDGTAQPITPSPAETGPASSDAFVARPFSPLPESNDTLLSTTVSSPSVVDLPLAELPADGVHFRRPWFALKTSGFEPVDVWPFVWQRFDHNIFLVALPLVSSTDLAATPCPTISAVITLLHELSTRIVLPPTYYASPSHMANIHLYLNSALPYGSPIDTDASRLRLLCERGFQSNSSVLESIRPAWRPYLFGAPKAGHRIEISLNEMIDAYQYDKSSIPDVARAWGIVQCRVLLNGLIEMQISLSLSGEAALAIVDLSSWGLHWCAQPTTQENLEQELKITCIPPSEAFSLVEYRIRPPFLAFPIKGHYQLKILSRSQVQISVQLQLHRNMSNQFDFCIVRIPMHNRGEIVTVDGSPSAGSLVVDPKYKNVLRWNVGDKFPPRQNMEVTLRALLTIDDARAVRDSEINDPFLTGSNAYCQVLFKLLDSSISGIDISPKSITLTPTPNVKVPISIRRSISSRSFLIWNSSGDVRRAIPYDSSATLTL